MHFLISLPPKQQNSVMLTVYTQKQKNLLEMVAAWNEKEERKYDDVEAALIYLFFRENGSIFNHEEFPSFVKLTNHQLAHLKENLEMFLATAEEMGFDLQVKEAIEVVNKEISSSAPIAERRKKRLNRWKKRLGIGSLILLFSWMFFSFWYAVVLACFGPYVFMTIEELVKDILRSLEKRNELKFSRILKGLNSNRIKSRLKWAENHLEENGWLQERRKFRYAYAKQKKRTL